MTMITKPFIHDLLYCNNPTPNNMDEYKLLFCYETVGILNIFDICLSTINCNIDCASSVLTSCIINNCLDSTLKIPNFIKILSVFGIDLYECLNDYIDDITNVVLVSHLNDTIPPITTISIYDKVKPKLNINHIDKLCQSINVKSEISNIIYHVFHINNEYYIKGHKVLVDDVGAYNYINTEKLYVNRAYLYISEYAIHLFRPSLALGISLPSQIPTYNSITMYEISTEVDVNKITKMINSSPELLRKMKLPYKKLVT